MVLDVLWSHQLLFVSVGWRGPASSNYFILDRSVRQSLLVGNCFLAWYYCLELQGGILQILYPELHPQKIVNIHWVCDSTNFYT